MSPSVDLETPLCGTPMPMDGQVPREPWMAGAAPLRPFGIGLLQNPAARLSSERSCFSLTLCIIALCFTDSVAGPGQEKQPSP